MAVHHADGVVDDSYLTVCLNSNPYTYLGNRPLSIAPEATLDRGLAIVCIRTMGFVPMLSIAASALGFGRELRRRRKVVYRHDLASVTVSGHGSFPYQVDGDFLGDVSEVSLRHEPAVLDVVMPGPSRPGA